MSKSIGFAFLIFSLLYLCSFTLPINWGWCLKVIPIALLILAVVKSSQSSIKTVLLMALVFSGCGDVLLAFNQFVFGVAAFLFAQLSYAYLFYRHWQGIQNRWPLSVLLICYMSFMVWLLLPKLGEMQLAVMAYLATIAFMGLLAIHSSLAMRWSVLGALVFIISDSLIAINKFVQPIQFESYWIMSSYYAAQFMLVTGFIKHIKPPNQLTKYPPDVNQPKMI